MAGKKGVGPSGADPSEKPLPPHQSSTEMIDRNKFLLHQLQMEIERLKRELARQKEERGDSGLSEAAATPEEILREARAQLERLRKTSLPPEEKQPPPPESPVEGPER